MMTVEKLFKALKVFPFDKDGVFSRVGFHEGRVAMTNGCLSVVCKAPQELEAVAVMGSEISCSYDSEHPLAAVTFRDAANRQMIIMPMKPYDK